MWVQRESLIPQPNRTRYGMYNWYREARGQDVKCNVYVTDEGTCFFWLDYLGSTILARLFCSTFLMLDFFFDARLFSYSTFRLDYSGSTFLCSTFDSVTGCQILDYFG
jgi:hypothetical protein